MKNLLLAGAFALASLSLPAGAMAQDASAGMTAQQQAMYNAWPMERRTMYEGWPDGVRTYYWTLDRDRQNMYWMMDDADRIRIYEMPMNERDAAWQQHMEMHAAMPSTNASMTTTTTPSRTTNASAMPAMRSGGMVQQTPAAHSGEYPPCRGTVQDNCVNPREAGLNYGNRPLDYWPGQPASQMDASTPQRGTANRN
ncbi:hypothetical protein GRI62_04315 [Erythrobacter arachoides]|uniref:Uncharacterized protein n=1 Tax=Aurantiacibacter arachoides TaxID=1850444 RepID=A0A845A041_9SPHN|nr:hypothetical protein [Aurantiacibacter arachoides]MXO92832.1 hypothetical protein [Aurantiacibacter arachoides]GGD54138.1 hypothetical protein GCM10011411_12560 [Aurantiacibacter arachoides]